MIYWFVSYVCLCLAQICCVVVSSMHSLEGEGYKSELGGDNEENCSYNVDPFELTVRTSKHSQL